MNSKGQRRDVVDGRRLVESSRLEISMGHTNELLKQQKSSFTAIDFLQGVAMSKSDVKVKQGVCRTKNMGAYTLCPNYSGRKYIFENIVIFEIIYGNR